MRSFRLVFLLLAFALAAPGCNSSPGNITAADLAAPADLAVAVDLRSAADLAAPPDLAGAPDLAESICGGRGGRMCDPGRYCELQATTCGLADQTGTCRPIPMDCTGETGPPACGCDGNTYANDCLRRQAGVSLKSVGRCDNTCATNADCAPGRLCCYPCGIPGCQYQCEAPMNGMCPMRP